MNAATCEYMLTFGPFSACGAPAVARYPSRGGGYMHLCAAHLRGHEKYSERLQPDGTWAPAPGYDDRE